MKILHTADWHLGKKLEMISRLEEQKAALLEICEIAERHEVDAVIIAGDIFDVVNPPIEALDLFYKTAKRLAREGKCAVIGIAGNHDSPDRIEAPSPLARECGILLTGYPYAVPAPFELETGLKVLVADKGFVSLKLPTYTYPLNLILTPYPNEVRLRTSLSLAEPDITLQQILATHWQELSDTYCQNGGVNILVAHLFALKKGGTPPEESEDERSILSVGGAQAIETNAFPSRIQYVALGHIHRPQVLTTTPCPVAYSGSPLSYSMSEAGQVKSVCLIEVEPENPAHMQTIPLESGKKLVKITFDSVPDAVHWLTQNPNTIVDLTLISDTYLTNEDRKSLMQVHPHLFIHLSLSQKAKMQDSVSVNIDLTKNIETLFVEYFQHKHKQVPNSELLTLFHEVLHTEIES